MVKSIVTDECSIKRTTCYHIFDTVDLSGSLVVYPVLVTEAILVIINNNNITLGKIILRNFKNATFYVDCFLYWVYYMLFPIQYFILSRDKQQLTVKRILLRPFILTLSRR